MRKTILFAALLNGLSSAAATETPDTIATQQLNEVVVEGEKPQVRAKDGIMVVDLPAIVKDKPVTNILEALGYLPGVISNNGTIGLAGASEVSIILNGEPTNMPLHNLYQLLYTTPVDRLKNVEIMYSAPAKYHVNGAVINVILKTPSPLDGLQGQFRAGYIRLITVPTAPLLPPHMLPRIGYSILTTGCHEPNRGIRRKRVQTIF